MNGTQMLGQKNPQGKGAYPINAHPKLAPISAVPNEPPCFSKFPTMVVPTAIKMHSVMNWVAPPPHPQYSGHSK